MGAFMNITLLEKDVTKMKIKQVHQYFIDYPTNRFIYLSDFIICQKKLIQNYPITFHYCLLLPKTRIERGFTKPILTLFNIFH